MFPALSRLFSHQSGNNALVLKCIGLDDWRTVVACVLYQLVDETEILMVPVISPNQILDFNHHSRAT